MYIVVSYTGFQKTFLLSFSGLAKAWDTVGKAKSDVSSFTVFTIATIVCSLVRLRMITPYL